MADLLKFTRTALTGGGATAVDGINVTTLTGNELCWANVANVGYLYQLNATSGATADGVNIILPVVGTVGNKRWIRQEDYRNYPLTNLLSNPEWKAMSGSTLENVGSAIYADSDGSTFASWTPGNCTMTDAGANLRITQISGVNQYAFFVMTTEIGKLYRVNIVIANGTGAWDATDRMEIFTRGGFVELAQVLMPSAGAYSLIFEATQTNNEIYVWSSLGAGETLNITSITLYEVTPGYVAADTLGPDEWYKAGTNDILREHNGTNTKAGSFYAIKETPTAQYDSFHWPLAATYVLAEHYKKFAGRTVTFGMWVKSSTASDVKLYIEDSDGTTGSSFHSGGGAYEWLEVTRTCTATITSFRVFPMHAHASPGTAYFSQPMLVFGSSIGEGNYQPNNEVIWLQSEVAIVNSVSPSVGFTEYNIESSSLGSIGKGIKAIYGRMEGKNTAAGKYLFMASTTGGNPYPAYMYSQVANVINNVQFVGATNLTGDISIRGEDGNWSTVSVTIVAIQP